MKATQGRVEVTSFEVMRNILQYGYYTVEAQLGCRSIHDAVHVDLDDRKLSKKCFTLDELRDLESKLVLITGSKAEHRKQVDHFLDVSLGFSLINLLYYIMHLNLCLIYMILVLNSQVKKQRNLHLDCRTAGFSPAPHKYVVCAIRN